MRAPGPTTTRGLAVAAIAAIAVLLAGCAPAAPAPSPSASALQPSSPPPTVVASTSPAPSSSASGSPGPTPSGSPTPGVEPSASPSPASASPSPSVTAAGCVARGGVIPVGARTIEVGDVNGAGSYDTAFLTTSAPWLFGVRTEDGVATLPDTLSAGGTHHLWWTGTDGPPGSVFALDDGRTAIVYRWAGCGIQQLRDPSGGPLALPLRASATGGTGLACNDRNGGVLLEESAVVQRQDGRFDVRWTLIDQVNEQGVVHLSERETRWSGLAADDRRVAQNETSHCWAGKSMSAAHD